MPFIGNQPALSYTSFAKQDFTTSATTSYTLDNPVANANELALFINFVRQEPTTAYSASGTTLTLTSATSSSDDMYCVYLGKAVQTVNPPNASVGTSQLADNGITTAKIINDAVTKDKLLSHNYPAFEAYKTSNQTLTDNALTKVQIETESFDTDNCYDNSTNYRFTPNVAGKYFVYTEILTDAGSASNLNNQKLFIFKNGGTYKQTINEFLSNPVRQTQICASATIDMNGSSDYLEIYIKLDTANGGNGVVEGTVLYEKATIFGAYRIGD